MRQYRSFAHAVEDKNRVWPKADVLLPNIKDWLPDFRFGRLDRL
jgi:hypothetical protein